MMSTKNNYKQELNVVEDLTHSNLNFLKKLSDYTLDSKLLACQKMSSRIMTCSKVDMELALKENIMPWEIEAFAAYSIIYNSDDATGILDWDAFGEIITLIRNYWHEGLTNAEKEGRYPETYFMISALQQFPVQGVFLQKLFRYHYFFTFQNDAVNMRQVFMDKMKVTYERLEEFAYILFMILSKESMSKIPAIEIQKVFMAILADSDVFKLVTIDEGEYRKQLQILYKDSIVDQYYGLKIQYLYPFISGKDNIYIPSPYLIINAVTESMLNRITYKDNKLRHTLGKEVIENYVFDIVKELSTTTWISREIEYYKGKRRLLTSDILASENDCIVFYDTKAITPSLKLRRFDEEEIKNDIKIYAEDVLQIYKQIKNYLDGLFEVDKKYSKDKIFGVVVVLEDAVVSRERVYDEAFSLIEDDEYITNDEKNYICSHIKVLPLRSIENTILENCSLLPALLEQVDKPEKWFNYEYSYFAPGNGGIPIYESYINDIKGRVTRKIDLAIKG